MKRAHPIVAAVVASILLVPLASPPGAAQLPPVDTIVLSGSEDPVDPSSLFDVFTGATMDARGTVAFQAKLVGPLVTTANDTGIWIGTGNNVVVPVIREGDPAPGLPAGITLDGAITIHLGGLEVAYYGFISGPGVDIYNDLATWQGNTLLVRTGDPAPPGFGAGVTWFAGDPNTNRHGHIAMGSGLAGPGIDSTNNSAIFVNTTGVWTLAARTGDPAPGGGTFANLTAAVVFSDMGFNDTGVLSFLAAVETAPAVYERSIFVGAPPSLQRVAREGDLLPIPSGGVAELTLLQDDPVLDELGSNLAFKGHVTGDLNALWAGRPGFLRPVAMEDDFLDTVQFQDFYLPSIAGDFVGFRASFWTPLGEGVYRERLGLLQEIARTGQPAPGAPAGAVFESFSTPMVNTLGQFVFQARMSGPPIDATNQDGIWIYTTDDVLVPVALEGMPLQISTTDTRTVDEVAFAGHASSNAGMGGGQALSARGQMLLWATFTDGVNALLLAEPERLFIYADGFEGGDLAAWSSSLH